MRFLAVFILAILAFAATYGGLAYTVNPRGDFPPDLFPNLIVDSLREKMHRFHVFQGKHPVGGILLGSSRSMKLEPETFTRAEGVSFFNFAVNNAHTEDMLHVYHWVRQQGAHPQFVVIGLDVEALHDTSISNLKRDEIARLQRSTSASGSAPSPLQQTRQAVEAINNTFTAAYIDDMVRSIKIKANPALAANRKQVFDVDGYLHYPRWEAQRRAGGYDLFAEVDRGKNVYKLRFEEMTKLSASRKGYLERLIAEIKQGGGQVILWITPIHPRIVAYLNRTTPYPARLQEVRDYVRQLHARYGIATYDCSEIARFGGTETEWYDGAHMDESNAARVMATILGHR